MQLAFLDHSLVRFIDIFDAVLIVIAFRRQEVRDRVDAVRAAATERAGRKAHRLTDFESMFVHAKPPLSRTVLPATCNLQLSASSEILITTKLPRGGIFNGAHFVVNGTHFVINEWRAFFGESEAFSVARTQSAQY
jgi:hypothetical protein